MTLQSIVCSTDFKQLPTQHTASVEVRTTPCQQPVLTFTVLDVLCVDEDDSICARRTKAIYL